MIKGCASDFYPFKVHTPQKAEKTALVSLLTLPDQARAAKPIKHSFYSMFAVHA